MKKILTLILIVFSTTSFGQGLTYEDWEKEAEVNKRLLPKYGEFERTQNEKKNDKEFIDEVMKSYKSKSDASDHMIDLGFQYLYKGDLKTAMYRFNQAYLLDNNNANIYWGYGGIYMAFGKFELSREQYDKGLKLNSGNDDILIDYGTTYLGEFYDFYQTDMEKANKSLDNAIVKLAKAYSLNPQNANASYKLSICYLYKNDCVKAKEYLKLSEETGNTNITDSYRNELEEKCNPKKVDCSGIKTGKYRMIDEESGETIIERTEKFQIEENTKFGYKLKLEISWIDECTYKLRPVEDLINPENQELPSMVLTCKIVEITGKGYIQISSSDIDPRELKTEVIRIE